MSTKVSCLVIDDEPLSQDLLIEYIERTALLELIGTANNGQQALILCEELKPDLLFLDIRMPRLNGFEFLDLLGKSVPLVIITSAFPEYALKGYEHAVVDFLAKPIFFDRFSLSIQRVEERLEPFRRGKVNLRPDQENEVSIIQKMLMVSSGRSRVNIQLDNIHYIESYENYVKFNFLDKHTKAVVSKVTVKKLMAALPGESFIRINRKYIVPVKQIQSSTLTTMRLFSGEELPIGVTYRESVRSALNNSSL